jgi:hypothetical protein
VTRVILDPVIRGQTGLHGARGGPSSRGADGLAAIHLVEHTAALRVLDVCELARLGFKFRVVIAPSLPLPSY